jgi:hypothetical protein
MVRAAQGERGEQSLLVRMAVEEAVMGVQPKDYLGEILAVRFWVTECCRYTNDPLHVELIKDPERIVGEIAAQGVSLTDCDEQALLMGTMALLLGRVAEFVVVGFGSEGSYSHVFPRVLEPRSNQWIVCDTIAGTDERGMLDAVTTYYTVSLDEPPEAVRRAA